MSKLSEPERKARVAQAIDSVARENFTLLRRLSRGSESADPEEPLDERIWREKQAMREADELAIASGAMTPAEVTRKNSMFTEEQIRSAVIDWSRVKVRK